MTDLNNEQTMTRYLLGGSSVAEQALIEDRLARDAAYFESLCALEDEIILRWHRGELSENERRLFTRTYLSPPARYARVESTRDLLEVIERPKTARHTPFLFDWVGRWLIAPGQAPRLAAGALAAILVAAVGLAVSVYRINVVTGQLKRAERENVELRQQTAGAQRLAVAFTLSAVGERSQEAANGMTVVRIPRQAAEVWLQFQIADPGTSSGFDAVLEPLDRTVASTRRPARVERMGAAALVTVTLAPSDVPDGDYVLRLRRAELASGVNPDVIATRTLRVTHE